VSDERAIRTALTVGPILACVGIAWTAMAPSTLSSSAVLVGVATAVWGTHKYGRLGAEQPETTDVADDEPISDP
jgi:hypothetical protein